VRSRTARVMMTLMRNGSRPSIGKPAVCHARKERVLLVGTDQRITSGPAARTAALKGRIHGCTRTLRKTLDSPLAPRAPSIHGTQPARAYATACPRLAKTDVLAPTESSLLRTLVPTALVGLGSSAVAAPTRRDARAEDDSPNSRSTSEGRIHNVRASMRIRQTFQ
jgi:hypothetical protein